MKKLWKVTVNNWGWDRPRTYFTESKKDAVTIYRKFPAADPVCYAGMYTDKNAEAMTEASKEVLFSED